MASKIPALHRCQGGAAWLVEFDGDRATGIQHFVFTDQQTHTVRLAGYEDGHVRTAEGWRSRRRSTTFPRKNGGFDSGRQHDPLVAREGGPPPMDRGELPSGAWP
jgi:hypothetical protein